PETTGSSRQHLHISMVYKLHIFIRPDNHVRSADDTAVRHHAHTQASAVDAVWPVISHHEHLAGRHECFRVVKMIVPAGGLITLDLFLDVIFPQQRAVYVNMISFYPNRL